MQAVFTIENTAVFKRKLLNFLQAQPVYALYDSNDFYKDKDLSSRPYYHSYDLLCAFGVKLEIKADDEAFFDKLIYARQTQNWLFGFLGYDLKNEVEVLHSNNYDGTEMPDGYFFEPETVLLLNDNQLTISTQSIFSPNYIWKSISEAKELEIQVNPRSVKLQNRLSKAEYNSSVEKLKKHIVEGDIYEVNFCQEFYADEAEIQPEELFARINQFSPQPFSALLKLKDKYVICASMERFLKKEGNKLISQPIKGTIRRGKTLEEDKQLQKQLAEDEKERAENIMIVDLVRNDLARSSESGSVKMEELCGVYDFPLVHQMISTVTSTLRPEIPYIQSVKNAFPMGSMTGAPKVRTMQLIEEYEKTKRGLYSGAIGYFTPDHDFDFNVVIRSFIYNQPKKYLSLHVGSAITFDSDAEMEFEECQVKIRGLLRALE
ncbi:MAG: anthranilate synthase component I family protein [Flavobacterium sp.]|nr:MAG: anthranilate synthase component I family protein [Flavobacterium sp.]